MHALPSRISSRHLPARASSEFDDVHSMLNPELPREAQEQGNYKEPKRSSEFDDTAELF